MFCCLHETSSLQILLRVPTCYITPALSLGFRCIYQRTTKTACLETQKAFMNSSRVWRCKRHVPSIALTQRVKADHEFGFPNLFQYVRNILQIECVTIITPHIL